MLTLQLQASLYDYALSSFFDDLCKVNESADTVVTVDFGAMKRCVPAQMVALMAAVHHWAQTGRTVFFSKIETCECRDYLQRMNFFDLAGIPLPEGFRRRDETARFVSLRKIGLGEGEAVDATSTAIAMCVYPEMSQLDDPSQSDPFDLVQYATSELHLNVD